MLGIGVAVQRQKLRRDGYTVLGKAPKLVADFYDEYYRANGGKTSFDSLITHSRAGNATMTDGYGPELVTNGGFDTDSDWVKGTGWTISGGKASSDGTQVSNSNLEQGDGTGLTTGSVYAVTFDSTVSAGTVQLYVKGSGTGSVSTGGTNTFYVTAGSGNEDFAFVASSNFIGSIDNVSVREMPVLKWAPHNLIPYSEQVDNWSMGGSASASDAETVTFTADSGDYIQVTPSTPASTEAAYTVKVQLWSETDAGEQVSLRIRLTGAADITADITLTDTPEWYTVSGSASGATVVNGVRVLNSSDSLAKTFKMRYAHLYRSDLGGMAGNPDQPPSRTSYVPTTSAASYLPRRGHHVFNGDAWVNEGVLAESEARTNLLTYSTPDSNWTIVGVTITEDSAVSPDGTQNATAVTESATTDIHICYLASAVSFVSGNTYTESATVKAGTRSTVQLIGSGSAYGTTAYVNFDLSDGTIGDEGTGVISSSIQPLGNGWYRCSMTANATATGVQAAALIGSITSKTAARGETFLGSTSNYFYCYHAQAEEASTPSSLMPTSGSTVTRAAETFTIPSANLPWPTPEYIGSELVTNGTFDTDVSGWTLLAGDFASVSEQGVLTYAGSSATASQQVSVTAGKVYRVTGQLVSATSASPRLKVGSSAGATDYAQLQAVGEIDLTLVATTSVISFYVQTLASGNTVVDNVSVREINPLALTIAMDGRVTYADINASTASFLRWYKDADNFIYHLLYTTGAETGEVNVFQKALGVSDILTGSTEYEPDVLVPYSLASRHGSTFLNLAKEGVAETVNTTPVALPDLSATDLDLAYTYMGTIQTFSIWDKDLGDAGLVDATEPSFEPSLQLSFDSDADSSFVVFDWS